MEIMNINTNTAHSLVFPIVHIVLQTLPGYLNFFIWFITMGPHEFLALLILILEYMRYRYPKIENRAKKKLFKVVSGVWNPLCWLVEMTLLMGFFFAYSICILRLTALMSDRNVSSKYLFTWTKWIFGTFIYLYLL